MILAIDPGKDKCGLAVLDEDAKVIEKAVFGSREITPQVLRFVSKYNPAAVVIGAGSFGKEAEKALLQAGLKANLVFISEKNSSWLARRRYWEENPPSGWWKFIPTSLRVPPVPVDDYAAVILAERYLKK